MMRRYLVSIALGVVSLATAMLISGAGRAADNPEIEPAAVDVTPMVTVHADSPMELRLAFELASAVPVRYLFRGDKQPIDFVYFHLLKDGQLLRELNDTPQRAISPRRVRELKPGEHLTHTVSLREQYGPLKPGTYTLEVKASGGPRDFGLSQIHLNRRVLYIEVVDR